MDRILVVLQGNTHSQTLLETARKHASGIDCEILVCRFVDEEDHEGELRKAGRSGKQSTKVSDIEATATSEAKDVARDVFGDSVSWTAKGVLGDVPQSILDVAADENCSHIFISGKKRSPTGKVLFGDIAQKVLLNFPGPVTITLTEQ